MATLVLTTLATASGLTGVAGAAVGLGAAVLGAVIDRQFFSPGSSDVHRTGPRLSEIHTTTSTEGAPVHRLWGRARLGGQMIWATRFKEKVSITAETVGGSGGKGGGGGGGGASQTVYTTNYAYSCSFAVAFCEGEAATLGQVWADGKPMNLGNVTYRFYRGSETQSPDGFIEAIEGAGRVPAYRGIVYLVFENLALAQFGNRIPQITAEIIKPIIGGEVESLVSAVTLIPGSGEFVYGSQVHVKTDVTTGAVGENMHNQTGEADMLVALDQLGAICPNVNAVLLVVAWFGDDLRCASCAITPRVELAQKGVLPADWAVNGISRAAAATVSLDPEGRPVYGGTPSDHVVVQAIAELKARGHDVIFYPFVLMDIPAGNGLPDPYGGAEQAAFPWRGRITCDPAPGEPASPDKSAGAASQVGSFFGAAGPADFAVAGSTVAFTGSPAEWGYRRMALHYAHLCEAAGGVDGFVIASELGGLTRVRSAASAYPAVDALKTLAADVSSILAPTTKVTYAADWSEYHSHRPDDGTGDVFFNLDPLWADAHIDAVGIDNYLPLSDWRDGTAHADAAAAGDAGIHGLGYLQSNIEGGEYYDWFYADPAARTGQDRTPIVDMADGEHWVFRNKDIRGWWDNPHHDRPAGARAPTPTAWTAKGKPVWFTEFGCPAVDKGTNEPNVFHDPKSSESALPHQSSGRRDDLIQRRYLEAQLKYWAPATGHNPTSPVYGGRMVDTARMFAWTWDARPFPDFPFRAGIWTDAGNYDRGHWLNGRLGQVALAVLVREICALGGLAAVDVSGLYGRNATVTGFIADHVMTPRAMLETLMQAFQFDAFESGGVLRFRLKGAPAVATLSEDDLVLDRDGEALFTLTRAQETELPQVVRVHFIDAARSYAPAAAEGRKLTGTSRHIADVALPLVISQAYARGLADVLVHDAWTSRDSAAFALPPSRLAIDPGDTIDITLGGRARAMQVAGITAGTARGLELVEVGTRVPGDVAQAVGGDPVIGPADLFGPTTLAFLDLPLMPDSQSDPRPRVAVHQIPWPGAVALYRTADPAGGFALLQTVTGAATMGELAEPLYAGPTSRWDRGNEIYVRIYAGELASAGEIAVLGGANTLAVENEAGGWEIVQFVEASLLEPGKYRLSRLLRGQLGSEHEMRNPVASGARVVRLDTPGPVALDAAPGERALPFTYRYGAAWYDHGHFTYREETRAFEGVALRPLSPARVIARRAPGSEDIELGWLRRGRIDADTWEQSEIALGEESEAYRLEILDGATVVRQVTALAPEFLYSAADQTADFGAPIAWPLSLALRISQLSATVGAGRPLETTLYFPLPVKV